MYPAFEKLPEDKKEKIIKVCIDEFVKNGFEKTSTDNIAAKAGISKGSVFHYFKSKKNLYFYLIKYVYHLLTEKTMIASQEIEDQDFFERIKGIVLIKQKIAIQYHKETQFIINALRHPPAVLKKECEDLYKKNWNTYEKMKNYVYRVDLIEPEQVRKNVSIELIVNFTMNILEKLSDRYFMGYGEEETSLEKYYEDMVQELDEYIDVIKYGVYKPE